MATQPISEPGISAGDFVKIKSLVRSNATNYDASTVRQIALHAYRMGSESCHRAIEMQPSAEAIDLATVERRAYERAFSLANGDVKETAKLLGVGKTTVYRKLQQYGLRVHYEKCPNCGCDLRTPLKGV